MENQYWQAWVAIYAAIVATGALFLEVRRWFESKPRLFISVSKNMRLIGAGYKDGQTYLVVNVTNRGGLPATLTNLSVMRYPTTIARLRRRHDRAGVVANPAGSFGGPGIPHFLEPGKQWTGMILYDHELSDMAKGGIFCIGIFASDRELAHLKRVHITENEIEEALHS